MILDCICCLLVYFVGCVVYLLYAALSYFAGVCFALVFSFDGCYYCGFVACMVTFDCGFGEQRAFCLFDLLVGVHFRLLVAWVL